jgi:hypothetical protein
MPAVTMRAPTVHTSAVPTAIVRARVQQGGRKQASVLRPKTPDGR